MISNEPDVHMAKAVFNCLKAYLMKKLMVHFDASYFGNLSTLSKLTGDVHFDQQVVRKVVREQDLLEIGTLAHWNQLCDFLKVRVPKESIPQVVGNTVDIQLALRSKKMIC